MKIIGFTRAGSRSFGLVRSRLPPSIVKFTTGPAGRKPVFFGRANINDGTR